MRPPLTREQLISKDNVVHRRLIGRGRGPGGRESVVNPAAALRVRAAILDSIRTLILFPGAGRRQTADAVRKLVTRKYPYLVYCTVDEAAGEAVILNIKHPPSGESTRTLEFLPSEIRLNRCGRK